MHEIVSDFVAESEALDALLATLSDDEWLTETPAEGWDVRDSVTHVAYANEIADEIARTGRSAFMESVSAESVDALERAHLERGRGMEPAGVLAWWRETVSALAESINKVPFESRLPWGPMTMGVRSFMTGRLMETWAHGLDVAEGLGVEVAPHDRVRHVVHLGVRTRGFSFVNAGLEAPTEDVHLALVAPGGETWEYGDPAATQRVTGSAWDFALLVTQRRHREDLDLHASGEHAGRWLEIAQAFAGPSGDGRKPGQFA